MNCPVCDGRLRAIEKYGVEVDICPDCKGVWLDRGELDKIIDMVSQGGPVQAQQPAAAREYREEPRYEEPRYERRHDDHHSDHDRYEHRHESEKEYYNDPKTGQRRRRPGSFLSDVFDMFGGGD